MSCFRCRNQTPNVCPACVSHNVQRFNERVAALVNANRNAALQIEETLRLRKFSLTELNVNLQNIRRETLYTRELVAKGQHRVDELRDRVTQRRQVLEEARRRLLNTKMESVNALKTQNKLKRKAWKAVFERIVVDRRTAVRESIALHRLHPLSNVRAVIGSEPCYFEIHGLPLSSIFCLRDYPVQHIVQAISHVANLTSYLAHYLGIKLPYDIFTYSSTSLQMMIEGNARRESLTMLETDPQSFAKGLAFLVVNIQHLCRTQGMEVRNEEEDLGRLLYGLLSSSTLGQYSDDVAYSAALDKDKRLRIKRAVNWDTEQLSQRIADDITTGPFEFIEKHLDQSEMSVVEQPG